MDCRKTLAEGRFVGLYVRNGWEFAARPDGQGVVGVLPVTSSSELILIEQYRPPAGGPVIELPAGLVGDHSGHSDESAECAGRRELLEETGYEADTMTSLGTTPSSAGLTTELVHLFLATNLTLSHRGGGVGHEAITIHRVHRADLGIWLAERQSDGTWIDFKIMAALWLAEERRLI